MIILRIFHCLILVMEFTKELSDFVVMKAKRTMSRIFRKK